MTTTDSPSAPAPATAAFTEAWLPGPDGTQFYTRTYPSPTPPRAVVLFVHGFAEHVGRYEWAHGVYAARGITVFAYDQRGFGRTALDKAKKSAGSAYGRTCRREQLADIEWWVKHVRREYPDVPVFLMGHSMGGGLVLAFGTQAGAPPVKETLSMLAGVVASSPLVLQTFPASKVLRFIGGKASALLPNVLVDAPVAVEDLSHDPVANEANANDELCIQKGSLKGVHDMLTGGEHLLANDYKHWPRNLPLLLVHGDADRITSFTAARELFDKVEAADKTFMPFEGGFHELVHEPEGVKERFVDECISWVVKRVEGGERSKL
ncbi:lysophospholipase [Ganoderma leucocontextum]|nr:lysophospholipase [Ganoderma leucocontextum]